MGGRLAGKVAVVTGAANGIGAATVAGFAAEGAFVVAADIDVDGAQATADAANGAPSPGGHVTACRADVSVEADLVAALDLAEAAYGPLAVLHSNATVGRDDDLDIVRTTDRAWDHQYRTTFASVALGARHAVARMTAHGNGGVILNTASSAAATGDHVRIAYGAMKAAVIALTRSIATTHGRHGIRANSIAPGLVLTPKIETVFPPAALAMIRAHQPLPWVTRPEDVADLAVFLASDESRCISGQTIVIDGGYSAAGPSTYELADLFGLGT